MAAFWEMMGVDVDAGPTTEHIKASFGRCEEWSREDRMRLGYLAIFTGFIEGRKYLTAIRASLARPVWAYFALPEFGANFGHPLPDRPSPLLLAYNGGKEHKFFKEVISKQTSVINFVHKDYAEMFPRWDFDVEDPAAENIIKKEGFQSQMLLRLRSRTASNELQITTSNPEKRGHEPGSESVNGAKAGQNDSQEPKQSGEPSLLVLDKEVPTDSDLQKGETRRQKKRNAAMVHQTPFNGNNTAKVIIPNKRVKLDPYFKTPMAKKPRRCPSRFYFTLRTPLEWLNDGHMNAFINVLKQRGPTITRNLRATRATSTA
ncbi:BnaCnng17530D [Brassica napus]|uniref:BnaCnng17530D protein n=1 Tax=Brassica napus TaxID=3708 RepID=A0A078IJI3_BRANA|nr:BnaCnng17530D [Brassica napus]